MEVKELRLGNHAVINGINTVVYQIEWRKKNIYRINDIDSIDKDGEDALEPIRLTEEWLKRTPLFEQEFCYLRCENKYGEFLLISSYIGQEYSIEVKYVHQLQNLFFALTQVELPISK